MGGYRGGRGTPTHVRGPHTDTHTPEGGVPRPNHARPAAAHDHPHTQPPGAYRVIPHPPAYRVIPHPRYGPQGRGSEATWHRGRVYPTVQVKNTNFPRILLFFDTFYTLLATFTRKMLSFGAILDSFEQ